MSFPPRTRRFNCNLNFIQKSQFKVHWPLIFPSFEFEIIWRIQDNLIRKLQRNFLSVFALKQCKFLIGLSWNACTKSRFNLLYCLLEIHSSDSKTHCQLNQLKEWNWKLFFRHFHLNCSKSVAVFPGPHLDRITRFLFKIIFFDLEAKFLSNRSSFALQSEGKARTCLLFFFVVSVDQISLSDFIKIIKENCKLFFCENFFIKFWSFLVDFSSL